MIKAGQDEARRCHPCWNREPQAQALRIELADGSSYVFPYARLAFLRFESGSDHDTLHVSLDTHEIQIVGENLRQLELALQKYSVDWVRTSPVRPGFQTGDDSASITSITVSEVQERESPHE
jgi:hypothetical protein